MQAHQILEFKVFLFIDFFFNQERRLTDNIGWHPTNVLEQTQGGGVVVIRVARRRVTPAFVEQIQFCRPCSKKLNNSNFITN